MSYLGNSPGVASQRIVTTFTATAGQTTFTPSSGYALGYCDVFQNGVKLVAGDDYTASNGTTVVLATGASAGDSVEVVAYIPRGLSDGYTKAEADALLAGRVNKAGDTITGRTIVSVSTGKQLTLAQWGDASSADGGQTMLAGNAYFDKTSGQAKFSNSHGTIGAVGVRFNSPSWNQGSLFTSGSAGSTADATFTPVDALKWDSAGRVTMPYQPFFFGRMQLVNKPSGWGFTASHYTAVVNRGGHYNSSTGYFTCPVAGDYECKVGGFITTGGDGVRVGPALEINGADYQIFGGQLCDSDTPFPVSSFIVSCSAGDTIRLGEKIYTPIDIVMGGGGGSFYSWSSQIRLIG